MIKAAEEVNRSDTLYGDLIMNSNSYAFTLIENQVGYRPSPLPRYTLPGWDNYCCSTSSFLSRSPPNLTSTRW